MLSRIPVLIALAFLLPVGFGCGPKVITPPPAPVELWKQFSGENAMRHVTALVNIGPRTPGSDGIRKAREYITAELQAAQWHVVPQVFHDSTPLGEIEFVSLIARFAPPGTDPAGSTPPPLTQRFIVCSHYDTKRYESIRFVGANDGGSSTGALLELARVLALDPKLAAGIELVFFDGEEAFEQFSATDGLYGSRFYARNLRETARAKQFVGGILWDMIGDANLTITLPPDSPAALVREIFQASEALGVRDKFAYSRMPIWDDHVPLNHVGIPTIDLIDFEYPPWHTADDTLDKLSPESLRIIGAATLYTLSKQAL